MPFPKSPRVIYRKNPLTEVVCQVRFPPILRIEAEPPAAFQERVRADYPHFAEGQPPLPPPQVPPEIANIIRSAMPGRTRSTVYEFASENRELSIALSRDSLALRTTAYRRWEDFRGHLERSLASLTEIYKPTFFSRTGLRYVDVIQRSKLALGQRSWSELLKPHIAGEFTALEIADQIQHAARELRVQFNGEDSVMIRHGIAIEEATKEKCFIIDSDFFTERRLEPNYALRLLDNFNRESGCLFRWCIQDALHDAMGPQPVGN